MPRKRVGVCVCAKEREDGDAMFGGRSIQPPLPRMPPSELLPLRLGQSWASSRQIVAKGGRYDGLMGLFQHVAIRNRAGRLMRPAQDCQFD